MYCILMDDKIKSFYMNPGEPLFYAYSSPSKRKDEEAVFGRTRLVEMDISDKKELFTELYNSGFTDGYLDGERIHISARDIYYIDRNPNELCFAQYMLTNDERYLKQIDKKELYALCKIDGDKAIFPMTKLADDSYAVLTYTDKSRIPQLLFDKYNDNYRIVKMSFSVKVLVNSKFTLE